MFLQSLDLQPREKMYSFGPEMLTTTELLSVILGSGVHNVPVHVLAKRIEYKLSEQKHIRLQELIQVKGIGLAKACQILAAIELVERLRPVGYPVIDSVDKVLVQVSDLRYASREHIACLYLNARLQLVLKETLSVGNLNQALLSPREIFSPMKQHPILYIILAHNHPSGDTTPSESDQAFTQQVMQAGELLGIHVLDHVVVGHHQHFSFKEKGLMPKDDHEQFYNYERSETFFRQPQLIAEK